MQKILVATTNPGKAGEYQTLLSDLNLEVVNLNDFDDFKIVDETGQTFKENTILKAKGYFSQFNLPALADDGGLEIDALNGEPGVRSHRWLGEEGSDRELVEYALKKMAKFDLNQRTARIVSWTAFYDGDNLFLEDGAIEGYIIKETPEWIDKGFPWRSILFIPQFNKLYRDLSPEEHELINQRRRIFKKLKPKIKQALKI